MLDETARRESGSPQRVLDGRRRRACDPGVDATESLPPSRAESAAHRQLKRLAVAWAMARRMRLCGTEVRLPRSGYRADVAAATPRALAGNAVTAVFECKASRGDYLRDSAPEAGAAEAIDAMSRRLSTLRALIGAHRPDLRRGEELFPEWDCVDLRGVRHDTHDRLQEELRRAQQRLFGNTKFARLCRWRAASFLYVVAEEEFLSRAELPEGWGLLVRRGDTLEMVLPPRFNETTPEERVAMVERIAAGRRSAEQGAGSTETGGRRREAGVS